MLIKSPTVQKILRSTLKKGILVLCCYHVMCFHQIQALDQKNKAKVSTKTTEMYFLKQLIMYPSKSAKICPEVCIGTAFSFHLLLKRLHVTAIDSITEIARSCWVNLSLILKGKWFVLLQAPCTKCTPNISDICSRTCQTHIVHRS